MAGQARTEPQRTDEGTPPAFLEARLEGGPASRALFARLLDLEHAPWTVAGAIWDRGHLEILVDSGGSAPHLFVLQAREGAPPGFVTAERCVLWYPPPEPPAPLLRHLSARLPARLRGVTMPRVAAALARDPGLRAAKAPPAGAKAGGVPGAAPPPPAGPLPPETPRTELEDRAPGALERLEHLLGLRDTPWRARAAAHVGERVDVLVVSANDQRMLATLRPAAATVRTLALGARLSLTLGGAPAGASEQLAQWCAAGLDGVDFARVAAWIDADPAAAAPVALEPDRPPSPSQPFTTERLPGWHEPAWHDFLAAGSLAGAQFEALKRAVLYHQIWHCDNECLQNDPRIPGMSARTLTLSPASVRARHLGAVPQLPPAGDPRYLTSDLGELDVVNGGLDKLERVLDAALEARGAHPLPLVVSKTCLPQMIGEDAEGLVRARNAGQAAPVLCISAIPPRMTKAVDELLLSFVERHLAAGRRAGPPADPRGINLVGFVDDAAGREIRDLLALDGIRVHSVVVPTMDGPSLERMGAAALDVYLPTSVWSRPADRAGSPLELMSRLYSHLRQASGTRWIEPPAPWGVQGTRRWLEAVHQGLGLPGTAAQAWDAHAAPWLERWERARARAARHRLGFVVHAREVGLLLDPAETWGVPLLEAAQEAGFGVDVLLGADDDGQAAAARARLAPGLREEARPSVTVFLRPEELRRLLAESPCAAVLTNRTWDWRTGEAGKSRFSLGDFEPGLPGAVRTAERLAEACELPFFRRYRKHLARTAAGLRPARGPA